MGDLNLTPDGPIHQLLVGPPSDDDRSIYWGCFLMAPWPGRLAGGRFDWRGRTIQLRRTHGRHAIHGLTWDRPWSLDDAAADVAELSIELPRMNGFSVCNKLKRDPALKDVPLIIMSSDSSEETFEQHRRLRTRAEDYIHKPIAFEQLLSRSKRQRDTEAATINMQLVTWRDGRAANEAFVAGTGDALRTWRQP